MSLDRDISGKGSSFEKKELRSEFAALIPIYLVVFSSFFDTHAQMPVLAPYAMSLGATPFLVGLVVGTYSFFNIVGNFASGHAIDRTSWKQPLLFGLLGVSLILILYTQASSALHLIAIRALHGFMGGILVPAALACLTTEQDRNNQQYGRRMAYFGAAIGFAAITGPLTAGLIANKFGYPAVYSTLAILMLVAAISAFFATSKNNLRNNPAESSETSFFQIFKIAKLQGAFLFAIGTMGATGTLASFLPVRADSIGMNHAQTGMLFATFALSAIVIQMLWPTSIQARFKTDYNSCRLGMLLLALALILASFANSASGLFAALALFGIGFGLSFQGMLHLVVTGSQLKWRGRAIGLFFATYSLGVALVPPISGLIWQLLPALFPFYLAAAITLACMFTGCGQCARNSSCSEQIYEHASK